MSLPEIALKLNKKYEALRKAEEERIRQSELYSRKLSYYNECGGKWFEALSIAVDRLIDEFNSITEEHSKLRRLVFETSMQDRIAVQFIRPRDSTGDRPPTGTFHRSSSELKITFEIEHMKDPHKESYEVVIRDFSSLKVRAVDITERQSLGAGAQWRDRETGEMEYSPTFVTKKMKSTQELSADEFAEYILSKFAERMI